jgi:catechol 2,3-dioxygenase-like lactoylglutathione lyase family enzyme
MLNGSKAFSGFSSNDIAAAKAFYADTLGLDATEEMGGLNLSFPGGQRVFIYPKDDHQPATFTVLNIEVDDIEAAVDRLSGAGVPFERYGEDFQQDARGIARDPNGPPIAWFKDPAGNIVSVIQTSGGPM